MIGTLTEDVEIDDENNLPFEDGTKRSDQNRRHLKSG